MEMSRMFHSVVNLPQQMQSQKELREGQLFSGKVIKVMPDNTAEIAALGRRFVAQLDASLLANERYFFQVASMKGPVQLAVLTGGADGRQPADQAAAVLEKLQLPVTKEAAAFATLSAELGKSMSREQIQTASALLRTLPLSEGLAVMRVMMSRDLPLSEPVFQALASARSSQSMTAALTTLEAQLSQFSGHDKAAAVVRQLLNGEAPPAAKVLPLPAAAVTAENGTSIRLPEANMIRQWVSQPPVASSQDQTAWLASAAKTPPSAQAGAAVSEAAVTVKEALFQLATKPITPQMTASFEKAALSLMPDNHPLRPALQAEITSLIARLPAGAPVSDSAAAALIQTAAAALALSSQPAAAVAFLVSDPAAMPTDPNGNWLKNQLAFLGVDHEFSIAKQGDQTQNVKQELLRLLSETMPPVVREAAEHVVNRVNAQHILSAENGPLQQIILQSPLQFGQFRGDVTIKWEGKKQPDGKIDASFCRVLFYVTMPVLEDTMIDMQVQNRIINVTVVSDAPVSVMQRIGSGVLIDGLKESLAASGYRLSGIQFKPVTPEEKNGNRPQPPLAKWMDEDGYTGVDLRI